MSERTIWRRVEKEKEIGLQAPGTIWCHNLCCWLEPYTPPVASAGKEIWRLLEEGEIKLQTDQQQLSNRHWEEVHPLNVGQPVCSIQNIRRRVTIPIADWPAPRYDDPAKCGNPERMILEWSQGAGGSSYWGCRARQWTPGRAWLEQPPVPVAQKSEAEKVWDRVAAKDWSNRDFFLFGFEQGKGNEVH